MKCCSLAIRRQAVLALRPLAPTVTVIDAMRLFCQGSNPAPRHDCRAEMTVFISSGTTSK